MAYPIPSITRMTFSDDFNSFSASPNGNNTTWMTSYPYGGDAARTLAGNNEAQYYSDSSVGSNPFSVSNGILSITASPGTNPAGLPYNSGVITTDTSFSQTYGYFETRAELPAGQGLWPAFWMLPSSIVYSSELDIFEVLEGQPSNVISTVHGAYGDTWAQHSAYYSGGDTSTAFHTYGVDWEHDTTTFYMDGNAVGAIATPSSMSDPMFMLLNLAVGGNNSWSGPTNSSTPFPAAMQIDYVRAYATAGTTYVGGPAAIGASAPAGTPTPAPTPAATPAPTGTDTLVLSVSENAWQGDAQFTVSVDGVAVAGTFTATATQAAGATQAVTIAGNWGNAAHAVSVNFVNDAYGGSSTADRNLYVNSVNYDGTQVSGSTVGLYSNGAHSFALAAAAPALLVLHLAEDAYLGDAQYSVAIDGNQVGSQAAATGSNAAGASTAVSLTSALTSGWHDLALSFLNDAYGGSANDRNLYLKGAEINGTAIASSSMALYSNGTSHVSFFVPQA